MSDVEKQNMSVKIALGNKLQNNLNHYIANNGSEVLRINQLSTLKNECIKEVKNADKELKHDREWLPIVKNLALILTGIGLGVALASIYYRRTTGRYGLFDNKEKILSHSPELNNFSTDKFDQFKKRYEEEINKTQEQENQSQLTM
jgi:hypothetical protein